MFSRDLRYLWLLVPRPFPFWSKVFLHSFVKIGTKSRKIKVCELIRENSPQAGSYCIAGIRLIRGGRKWKGTNWGGIEAEGCNDDLDVKKAPLFTILRVITNEKKNNFCATENYWLFSVAQNILRLNIFLGPACWYCKTIFGPVETPHWYIPGLNLQNNWWPRLTEG